jgi:hypothetical protein
MVSSWRSAAWALKRVRIAHASASVVAILAVGIALVAAPACTPQPTGFRALAS